MDDNSRFSLNHETQVSVAISTDFRSFHWQKGVTNADDYTWGTSSLTDGAKMGNHGWLGVNVLRENHGDASPSFRFVMSMMMIIHSTLVLENNRMEENPASE